MMEAEEGHRRSTRAALAEIPLRLGQLRVSPPRLPEPLAPINLNAGNATNHTPRHAFTPNTHLDNTPAGIISALLSPTPSPDELVIQQRGRRRIPVTWSPDIDFNKKHSPFQTNNRTPPKVPVNMLSPLKNGIVLRSTPRKRLLMNDVEKPTGNTDRFDINETTPQKHRNQSPSKASPVAKKIKLDRNIPVVHTGPLDIALKGLSNEQLISVIANVIQKHPEVDQEIRKELPLPDMKPYEETLQYLKRNIFRSLPTSRLTSKTDSPAYSRAATHIIAFKKQLVDIGRTLNDSQRWQSVMEYALMAWCYVRGTPLWDNHPHNSIRRQCFKFLSGLCITALKKGLFDKVALQDIQEKLELMVSDSDDIQSCLKLIDVQIKSLC